MPNSYRAAKACLLITFMLGSLIEMGEQCIETWTGYGSKRPPPGDIRWSRGRVSRCNSGPPPIWTSVDNGSWVRSCSLLLTSIPADSAPLISKLYDV